MEAHHILLENGFSNIYSYGAGSRVKMPGEAENRPNIYDFGTSYTQIYNDLRKKNQSRYTSNGILQMIDRDRKVKEAPERFQDEKKFHFDIIIAYEKRVYEIVVNDLMLRNNAEVSPCHVINLDTTDNRDEARNSALLTLELVREIASATGSGGDPDWENHLTRIFDEFEAKFSRHVLHTVLFY